VTPASALPAPGLDADRDLPLDSHLHTDLSPDSDVPIDAYCEAAVARGIPEIAITDHVDFDPRAPASGFADFATRERSVRDAAERWADRGLAVRLGVEVTWEPERADEIRDYLARHPYDFVVGSCHVGPGSPFRRGAVAAWCSGRTIREAVAPYFAEVLSAARCGLFDALGHLDVVKKHVAGQFPPAAFAAAPDLYEPVLLALVETGTGLEINSSGLRQAPREAYPAPWVVGRFRELGGSAVTIGSDAHRADSFAWGLGHAYAVAAHAGYGEVAIRRGSGPRAGERVAVPDRVLRWATGG
jgi:histidinol-phosphatase (PHP family)